MRDSEPVPDTWNEPPFPWTVAAALVGAEITTLHPAIALMVAVVKVIAPSLCAVPPVGA